MDELDAGKVIPERDADLFRSKANPLPVSLSAAKIIGSEGAFLGYLFILRDLGEIRRLQKQLRQSERLSALGNLAAGVAHEIRNPLSSIKGYATYLTEKLKNDKMAYATGNILIQETERLNRVMSDLLSVAKPLDLRLQPVRIENVLEQAVRVISSDAEEKGVAVHLRLPRPGDGPQGEVRLDPDRLIQALLNLLVNAVQATEPGRQHRGRAGKRPGAGRGRRFLEPSASATRAAACRPRPWPSFSPRTSRPRPRAPDWGSCSPSRSWSGTGRDQGVQPARQGLDVHHSAAPGYAGRR